jgi:hypothetical protein
MSVSARILTVAGLAAVASACILVVPSAEPGGAHCKLAGLETECGRCMADRCSAAVDACCFDDACGGVIADVDTCATETNEACVRVADPSDRGGRHADLSACVAKECATSCRLPPAPSSRNLSRCQRAYVTSVDACECEIGPTANDTECTEVGHPGLRCCAPDDWPGPVRSCECLKIICVTAGAGCLCQLSPMDDRNRATDCQGATCCYDPSDNRCSCATTACRPSEKQVPSCTIEQLGCDQGRHRVEACTVPKP